MTGQPETVAVRLELDLTCSSCAERGHYEPGDLLAYVMEGHCTNCGTRPVFGRFTSGHEALSQGRCPMCGCNTMHWVRLASAEMGGYAENTPEVATNDPAAGSGLPIQIELRFSAPFAIGAQEIVNQVKRMRARNGGGATS